MALVGFLLQITIIFSYWTSCEFTWSYLTVA